LYFPKHANLSERRILRDKPMESKNSTGSASNMNTCSHSEKVSALRGMGVGTMAASFFGAAWIAWGLSAARLFHLPEIVTYEFMFVSLMLCSAFLLVKSSLLHRTEPSLSVPVRRTTTPRALVLIVVLEGIGIGIASFIGHAMDRPDLVAVSISIIVGVHFLPFARIFNVPNFYVLGITITSWSVLCWLLFRSGELTAAVGIGTGVILWINSAAGILYARKFLRLIAA
jgi:hypothetical protein